MQRLARVDEELIAGQVAVPRWMVPLIRAMPDWAIQPTNRHRSAVATNRMASGALGFRSRSHQAPSTALPLEAATKTTMAMGVVGRPSENRIPMHSGTIISARPPTATLSASPPPCSRSQYCAIAKCSRPASRQRSRSVSRRRTARRNRCALIEGFHSSRAPRRIPGAGGGVR